MKYADAIHIVEFQFQNGAIIRTPALIILVHMMRVSIPKWCDYKLSTREKAHIITPVSIPKWCDYKL